MPIPNANLMIDVQRTTHIVSPWINGGCIEQIGNSVYDGIWVDEASSYSKREGLRTECVELLHRIQPGILRWPGGTTANYYHFQDGIGPKKNRKKRLPLYGQTPDSNHFGTHEFMDLCSKIGSEPMLVINTATGSIQEALDWIEYCNGTANTEWANLRESQGTPQPFHVDQWQIGSDPWNAGGGSGAEQYASLFLRYAALIKHQYPSVQLAACVRENMDWNQRLLQVLKHSPNLINRIVLEAVQESGQGAGGSQPKSETDFYRLFISLSELESTCLQLIRILDKTFESPESIPITIGKWGIRHPGSSPDTGYHQVNTLRDALFSACLLHILGRFSQRVDMACLAYPVNALHCWMTTRQEDVVPTPTYHAFAMLQEHLDHYAVDMRIQSPRFHFGRFLKTGTLPFVDGFCTVNPQSRSLVVTLVNLHLEKEVKAVFHIRGGEVVKGRAFCMTAKTPLDQNTFVSPHEVEPKETRIDVLNPLTQLLPPYSLTKMTLELKQ